MVLIMMYNKKSRTGQLSVLISFYSAILTMFLSYCHLSWPQMAVAVHHMQRWLHLAEEKVLVLPCASFFKGHTILSKKPSADFFYFSGQKWVGGPLLNLSQAKEMGRQKKETKSSLLAEKTVKMAFE